MKELSKKIFVGGRPVIISGAIYTAASLVIVLSAWLIGLHRYDLGRTISAYIGFRVWTAILYFFCATAMFTILVIYIYRTPMPLLKKFTYFFVFFCVWGCSIFPCNDDWSEKVTNVHLGFAYGLMFSASFTFLINLFLIKRKGPWIFAAITFAYAVCFIIALLLLDWKWFDDTIFIWENLCIYLLMVELYLEHLPIVAKEDKT